MAIPVDVQAALDRLVQYNSNPVGAGNPFGMGNYGNLTNFPAALSDVSLVADWFGETGGLPGPQGDPGNDGSDGTNGREIELQKSATHLQWRYVGDAAWIDLVPLADLVGAKGDTGDPGTTDYLELENRPALGTAASKDVATTEQAIEGAAEAIMDAQMTRVHVLAGLAPIRLSSGASLDIQLSDNNSIIDHTHSSTVTCALPADLPIGFGLTVIQGGAGKITFSEAPGAEIRSEDNLVTTRGLNSAAALTVIANTGGTAAVYYLAGGLE